MNVSPGRGEGQEDSSRFKKFEALGQFISRLAEQEQVGTNDSQMAINLLTELIPFAKRETSLEGLMRDRWQQIGSFRYFKPNGAVEFGDLKVMLEELHKQCPVSDDYWEFCILLDRPDVKPGERVDCLLKRARFTEAPIDFGEEQFRYGRRQMTEAPVDFG